MAAYTTQQLADMHLMYGEARGNSREARRLYGERFPHRRLPSHTFFQVVDSRLRETGSVLPPRQEVGRPRSVRTHQFAEDVLTAVAEHPGTSTRVLARARNTSHVNVWRVLSDEGMHPFKLQKVQELLPRDFRPRMEFCQWLLHQLDTNPHFGANVLWTDEAIFTRMDVFNSRNSHVWDFDNPHALFVAHHQHRFSVNVWCGIVHDHLIGPYILPVRLNGRTYHAFLSEVLPELLETVPLALRQEMWYQHDGAPAHFDRNVRHFLHDVFRNRFIGRDEPVPWPPRSPDLNPLDFFFWGEMKTLVYDTPVTSAEDLVARINVAAATVADTPGLFARTRQSLIRRCHLCVEVNGRHFENRL